VSFGERATVYVPFVLAVLFPPVGLLLGLVGMQRDDERDTGVRLIVVSVLAAVVWALLLLR
jgi:hypothetical protein